MATEITGTIAVSPVIQGEIVAPLYITSGIAISPIVAVTINSPPHYDCIGASVILPSLTLYGEGNDSGFGIATISLPSLSLSAAGNVSAIGIGAVTIPSLSLSAIGDPSIIGTALLALPRLTLQAETLQNVTGTLSVSLPALRLTASSLIGITGSLDRSIPPLTLSATGILSIEGTATITLPGLTLSAFSLPTTAYLSMVLNLKNRALTLYDNYDFNSMCRFNGKHFGATKTAIYDLDSGTTDAGTLIDWNFRTGYLDLEQKSKKKLRQAWLSYKASGDIILTVIQPNEEEYEYTLSGIDITETGLRVKFGKGIRSKYVALDIKNVDGSTITLDVLKLALEKTSKTR